jgi:16S rRNA (cytosine1402-N4)-methyltransferase
MSEIAAGRGFDAVDGVLLDLGVSMHQLMKPARGFSFASQTRLDMRMDPAMSLTAWDVVNTYRERDIERILAECGEEHRARRIARAIAWQREKRPIETCAQLADVVLSVCGRHGRVHPATRTFQALRIEVNKELEELGKALSSGTGLLKKGGRICVISYHSLEDRIVKHFTREHEKSGRLRILTKKPITPDREEVRRNPSSRSAKLRGAEKV